ncbi:hypothetical protein Btru_009846 [Bulinus truncatus]|nr:hypothetical protein Btru_009846 [Bulinus truncatus]
MMTPGHSMNNVLVESHESSASLGGNEHHAKETDALIKHKTPSGHVSSCYIPARYILALWSFLGFINMFTIRMDLNIAILAMVDTQNETSTAGIHVSASNHHSSKFNWSESEQDNLLGSFFYGYCSTQILGGYLSGKVGPKLILGYGILATSILSLLTPLAATYNYYLLITCRVLQGLSQGLAQPCMHTMWSKWAPEREKSWLMTVTYAGCQVGMVIATWVAGYLADCNVMGGWPLVFYIFGGFGLLWSIGWLLLIHDTPAQHPRISQSEKEYIESNVRTSHGASSVQSPMWCTVLRSPALLAIVAAHFANDWGAFALTVSLPSYLHHVLNFPIRQNGFMSSLPFIVLMVTNPLSGYLADKLRGKNILSTKNTRKLVNSVGLFIPSALMFGVCYVDSDRNLIVTLLTLAVGFSGFTMAGYSVNHLDIAPTFAGVLYGLTNTIGTTTGFIGPAILATLTHGVKNKSQWMTFFYLTSGIFFFGGLIFLIFAEGEPQDWLITPVTHLPPPDSNNQRDVIHHAAIDILSDCYVVKPQSKHLTKRAQNSNDEIDSHYSTVKPQSGPGPNSIQTSEDVFDTDWEALVADRRQRRTAHVSSFSHLLYSL